ncbi:hypothetical protein [Nocardia sp. NPDC051981]|uniref:hypothetical protein n=1 Tax=Nocardia sp. NPDC051981 TaxID=3155417 RepID=UPI00344444A1
MTDLALTPKRRAELVALLGDEPHLRTEFPRVADYLDSASRLPGSRRLHDRRRHPPHLPGRTPRRHDIAFFDTLASTWHLDSEDPHYVSWWNLTDTAQSWTRR